MKIKGTVDNQLEYIHFLNQGEFRKWLSYNHSHNPGIWMVFYKKHLKTEGISYDESLDEALCYGWIDSIIKRVDDDRYARKFIPRKDTVNWSAINKKKVLELVKNGSMTEAGLRKIDSYLKNGKIEWGQEVAKAKITSDFEVPAFIIDEFSKNEPALKNFNLMAKTYKKHFILWITHAKREETIRNRLKESTELLKLNKKLGLK